MNFRFNSSREEWTPSKLLELINQGKIINP